MLSKIFIYLLSLPKTLFYNFRYLPFRQAVHFPIVVRYDAVIRVLGGGKMLIDNELANRRFLIRIGFHHVPVCDMGVKTYIEINNNGCLVFNGAAHIGHGSKFCVHGKCELGDEFAISSNATIYCYNSIKFGRDCLLGWDVLVMDSDSHTIYDKNGKVFNTSKPITIGDKVWLCYGSTVLKGASVPKNCVVGAKSLVTGTNFLPNTLIVGSPAKSIKEIQSWNI